MSLNHSKVNGNLCNILKTLRQKNCSRHKAVKLTYVIAAVAKKLPAEWEASVYWFKGQTECAATTLIDRVILVSNR